MIYRSAFLTRALFAPETIACRDPFLRTPEAFARLDEHQRLISDQIAVARWLAEQHPNIRQPDLSHARWRMARLLRIYQLFKHIEIFDPLIASVDPSRTLAAKSLKAACIAAGERYNAYVLRWSNGDAEMHWLEYTYAFQKMVRLIEQDLAIERREIRHLLANTTRTRHN